MRKVNDPGINTGAVWMAHQLLNRFHRVHRTRQVGCRVFHAYFHWSLLSLARIHSVLGVTVPARRM